MVAQEKGITLLHEGIAELPEMQADASRLFNAFYNLVNNAIADVPNGGSITIKGQCDSRGKTVHLSVVDTGRGMTAEIRETLFTPKVLSLKQGGTGLGIKIVKDVIEAHSGVIAVESAINVGTTFHIHLPMDPSTGLPPDNLQS
jgi:signal transduction histidine kinase